MRPKRPAFLVSALLTVVVLLLSACGASYNSQPSATVTLTYWYSGDPSYGSTINKIISNYEQYYPNVKVNAQYMAPDQEHDAYVAAVKSGTAPDVMALSNGDFQQYAARRAVFPRPRPDEAESCD